MKNQNISPTHYFRYALYSYFWYTLSFIVGLFLMGNVSELFSSDIKEILGGMILPAVFVSPLSWFANALWLFLLFKLFKKTELLKEFSLVIVLSIGMGAMPLTTFIPLALLANINI